VKTSRLKEESTLRKGAGFLRGLNKSHICSHELRRGSY
jgi:hypothetical protein